MKKKKPNKNRGALKESITHGVFTYHPYGEAFITCRNTDNKHLPLPVKFQELLLRKYLKWWHIKLTISKWGRKIRIENFADYPVEFVISHIPELYLMVISICHPIDQFKRRSGVKIVKQRMKWALEHPSEKRNWKFKLK